MSSTKSPKLQIQIRSEFTGIRIVDSMKQAKYEARMDKTIWKISFSLPNGERIRLVRHFPDNDWIYLDIMDEIRDELDSTGGGLPQKRRKS
jgi:hypothetical protein